MKRNESKARYDGVVVARAKIETSGVVDRKTSDASVSLLGMRRGQEPDESEGGAKKKKKKIVDNTDEYCAIKKVAKARSVSKRSRCENAKSIYSSVRRARMKDELQALLDGWEL